MSLARLVVPIAALRRVRERAGSGTRLLRHPTVSRDQIAFEYAGDLWVVPRDWRRRARLTATPTVETDPHFSPDGSQDRVHRDASAATPTSTSFPPRAAIPSASRITRASIACAAGARTASA